MRLSLSLYLSGALMMTPEICCSTKAVGGAIVQTVPIYSMDHQLTITHQILVEPQRTFGTCISSIIHIGEISVTVQRLSTKMWVTFGLFQNG